MGSNVPPSGSGFRTAGDKPVQFRAVQLRLVVVGRLGLARDRLHRLADDGVEGLLDRTAPTLSIRVADHRHDNAADLTVTLGFRHRRDFTAAAVARALPGLANGFVADHTTRTDAPADTPAPPVGPASAPDPTQPALEASGDDAIDRLLDMVAAPPTSATPPQPVDPARAALSGFISEVTRGSRRPSATAAQQSLRPAPGLANQIAAIVDHPDFRALERGWGTLRFLARRIDRRAGIAVDVLEADSDGLADALETLVPEDDLDPAGPVRLVVDLNDYDASDRDIARLRRLGAFGASRRAVLLANASPAIAGDGGLEALAAMHDPETLFEASRHAAWRTLRDAPEAAWLGLCLSRMILRDSHDGQDNALGFSLTGRVGQPLDVGVAPAVAALFAAAAAATDWACSVGTASEPVIDDLVLREKPGGGFEGPVRPSLSVSAAESLAAAGFITLVPERGRDSARLLRAPAVRRGANASLITRLFQAQVIHGLQWNADRLFAASNPATVRDQVELYLTALASSTGPGARVEVTIDRDDEGLPVLAIAVHSGSRAAPGTVASFEIPFAPATSPSDRDP